MRSSRGSHGPLLQPCRDAHSEPSRLHDAKRAYNETMSTHDLSKYQSETLLAICRNPGISHREVAWFTYVADSSAYEDIETLRAKELIVSANHGAIHLPPTDRYWPTPAGIETAAAVSKLTLAEFIRAYPVSRAWQNSIIRRLDGLASVYRLAATLVEIENRKPLALRLSRQGPFDGLLQLSETLSVGIVRQGRMRSKDGFEQRLDEIEWNLGKLRPSAILVTVPSRRDRYTIALDIHEKRRSLYRRVEIYIGTESGDLLTDAESALWQSTANLRIVVPLNTLVQRVQTGTVGLAHDYPDERPIDGVFPINDPVFELTPDDKMIMGVLVDRPKIRRDDLMTYTGKSASIMSQHMRRLARLHGMVEQEGSAAASATPCPRRASNTWHEGTGRL